jgi:hypothetical protein
VCRQDEEAILATQLIENKKINTKEDICNKKKQMQGQISEFQQWGMPL